MCEVASASGDAPELLRARPSVLRGPGALAGLKRVLASEGCSRPLVVTSPSVRASPWFDPMLASLSRPAVVCDVLPHSPLPSVLALADHMRRGDVDAIVSVGGGSTMVTARAANILAHEAAGIDEICTKIAPDGTVRSPRMKGRRLPHLIVPSTPSTAATTAGAAVAVPGRRSRVSLYDLRCKATAVIVDSRVVEGTPGEIVRSSLFNAYAMAVEGLLASRATPATHGQLRAARRLLAQAVSQQAPKDTHARLELIDLALVVGEATATTGLGLVAGLSHTIGHHYAVDNGLVDAVLLPRVLRRAAQTQGRRTNKPELDLLAMAEEAESLLAAAAAPVRLRDLGIPEGDLGAIAEDCRADIASWADRRGDPSAEALVVLSSAW